MTLQLAIGIGFLFGAALGWLLAGKYHFEAHRSYLRMSIWWQRLRLRLALWWSDEALPYLRGILVRR